MNHSRLAVWGLVGLAALYSIGLSACERPATQGVTTTQPRGVETGSDPDGAQPPAAADTGQEADQAEARDTKPADATAATIDMEEPEQARPPIPRFISITEEVDPQLLSSVDVSVLPPRKLELKTENIRRLRLTREGLPLTKNASIVLQIDGQGIEWTSRYIAVELERSPTGIWTVIARRAYQP